MAVERLDWLAKNPRYTKRFAMHVGALCREMTNKAVAEVERFHESTVKDLDKIYMAEQVARAASRTLESSASMSWRYAEVTSTGSSSATSSYSRPRPG